ncbi:MAG: hypothetical protein J5I93_15950 [Pirellulaceae bacterium]|nr:hypothetical protein [Pirellulaceae bacterium]
MAAVASPSSVGPYDLIKVYHGHNGGELCTTLPIPPGGAVSLRCLYRVEVANLQAGDWIEAIAQFQLTEPYTTNVGLSTVITLNDSANEWHADTVWPFAHDVFEICEANGMNLTPGRHHEARAQYGERLITTETGTQYVEVWAWGYCTVAGSGWKFTVDQDYGRLVVKHWRPRGE